MTQYPTDLTEKQWQVIIMTQYPTDLTEKQWQVIKNILEPQARNRKHSLKEIMNAILYINKTGCQWRMLPSDFAPWQTVYYYFRKWKLEGVFEEVMDALHSLIRKQAGREESPSLGIMDSGGTGGKSQSWHHGFLKRKDFPSC